MKNQAEQVIKGSTSDHGKRDLGTLIQLTGRLIEHFLGERFLQLHDQAASVLDLLLQLAEHLLSTSSVSDADIELLSQDWSFFYFRLKNKIFHKIDLSTVRLLYAAISALAESTLFILPN